MINKSPIPNISDGEIRFLHFPEEDVFFGMNERYDRNKTVQRTIANGIVSETKVRIEFQDVEGQKIIETSIWEVSCHKVILRNGDSIPIHRIVRIDLLNK